MKIPRPSFRPAMGSSGGPQPVRGLLLGSLAAVLVAFLPAMVADADTDPGYVTATATFGGQANVAPGGTITGLQDLDDIALNFQANGPGNQITLVQVRQCRSGSNISSFNDFRPTTGGKCVAPSTGFHPPDGGFLELTADDPPGLQHVAGSFEVGTGTAPSQNEDGPVEDIVCDATHACELWARVAEPQNTSLPNSEAYIHWNLQFAGTTSSTTSSATSSTTSSTTSTTTPGTTTTTSSTSTTSTTTPSTTTSTTAPSTTTTTALPTTTTTALSTTTTTTVPATTTTTAPATTTTTVPATTTTTGVPATTTTTKPASTTSTTKASTTTSTTAGASTTSTSSTSTSTTSTTLPAGTTVTPTTVPAGGSVTVASTGWQPNGSVAVTLTSDPVSLPAMTADASGKIAGPITIPGSTSAGSHTLTFTGKDTAGVDRTVTAGIAVIAAGGSTTSTTKAGDGSLPRTGSSTLRVLWTATALVVAGGLFLEAARRRRMWDRIRP